MIKIIILSVVVGVALGQWTQIPGHQAVDLSGRGNELWSVHRNGTVYRMDMYTLEWVPLSNSVSNKVPMNGKPVMISASPDGYSWMLTDKRSVYRWNNKTQIWDTRVGILDQINAVSKSIVVGVNDLNDMYEYENQRATEWNKLPGKAYWISTGLNNECWMIDMNRRFNRWDDDTDKWVLMPGFNGATIDVYNASSIVATSTTGRVYTWDGKGAWNQLPGSAKRATISKDRIYAISEMENMFVHQGYSE